MNRQTLITVAIVAVFIALGLLIFLRDSGEFAPPRPETSPGKVLAVATIHPFYDLACRIGGDDAEVRALLPAGASPHTYSPTPEDARNVYKAQVVFMFGRDVDNWASKLHKASRSSARLVVISGERDTHETHEGHSAAEGHAHEGEDPHFWMDPVKMLEYAETVERHFSEIRPEARERFAKRRKEFEDEINVLVAEYSKKFSKLSNRKFIAYHSAYIHLAERFGLEQLAVIEASPGKGVSPGSLKKIIELIRANGIRAIYAEPQFSDKFARTLTRETGVPVKFLDPLGNPSDPERATYTRNLRKNLDIIWETLNEQAK